MLTTILTRLFGNDLGRKTDEMKPGLQGVEVIMQPVEPKRTRYDDPDLNILAEKYGELQPGKVITIELNLRYAPPAAADTTIPTRRTQNHYDPHRRLPRPLRQAHPAADTGRKARHIHMRTLTHTPRDVRPDLQPAAYQPRRRQTTRIPPRSNTGTLHHRRPPERPRNLRIRQVLAAARQPRLHPAPPHFLHTSGSQRAKTTPSARENFIFPPHLPHTNFVRCPIVVQLLSARCPVTNGQQSDNDRR